MDKIWLHERRNKPYVSWYEDILKIKTYIFLDTTIFGILKRTITITRIQFQPSDNRSEGTYSRYKTR